MPWREVSGGYTKKTKSGKGGGFITNPRQYEKLRSKGFSKESAARITNFRKRADMTSPFGIEHDEIAKAKVNTEKGRRARRLDQGYERPLSTKELRGAGYLGMTYTAAKAPKGKRLKAMRNYDRYRFHHPVHGSPEGGYGYAKQRWEEDLAKHYLGRHREPYSPHTRAEHPQLRSSYKAARDAAWSQAARVHEGAKKKYQAEHPFIHAWESGANYLAREKGRLPSPTSADRAATAAVLAHWETPTGKRAIALEERARGKWNPRYERKRKAQIAANRQLAMAKSAFGVDHEDISKISFGALGGKVDQFFGGAKMGLTGRQGPQASALGGKAQRLGAQLRSGPAQIAPYTKKNLKPLGIGAGVGAVGAGGIAALNSDRY